MSQTRRCAIYTRKSSEEGLEQGFNSLDAQRDACASFVASQHHEGWRIVKTHFDDGGVSGGSLERPALQELLAEIDAGRIDIVVVYKIDRLTRSLTDFTKLVDRFDAAECSFVSVTQAFNTSSSMGRLTLNVLLSFAQFEREVTAERIRDKIAASKKKGLWMGGKPPLGYDPHPDPTRRELIVNEAEAQTVRTLFELHQETSNLRKTAERAEARGLRSKLRPSRSGSARGGRVMDRGHIHRILTNPIYRGLIAHKSKTYPGKHRAVIEEALWSDVQSKLQATAAKRRGSADTNVLPPDQAPLIGRLCDDSGDRLTPSHTTKSGKRYRYYVSHRLIAGTKDPTGWRLPARDLELVLGTGIATHLRHHAEAHSLLKTPDVRGDANLQSLLSPACKSLSNGDENLLRRFVSSGRMSAKEIHLNLNLQALSEALKLEEFALSTDVKHLVIPIEFRKRGVEMKLITGTPCATPDPKLINALNNAHRWAARIHSGTSLAALAKETEHTERYLSRIALLALMSPKIQQAILLGTAPPHLTLDRLITATKPLSWTEQETLAEVVG